MGLGDIHGRVVTEEADQEVEVVPTCTSLPISTTWAQVRDVVTGDGQGWKGIQEVLVTSHLPFQVHPPPYSTHMDSIIQAPLPSDYYVGHPGKHQQHIRVREESIFQGISSPTPSSVSAPWF